MSILLVAGLPFDGTFWSQVQKRLSSEGLTSHTWNLCEDDGPIAKQAISLQTYIDQHQITTLVAHGFGVHLVLQVASNIDIRTIIISNGFLSSKIGIIQWVWPQISTLPNSIKKSFLRPTIARRLLASSAAFRRLVINPYVMDDQTIEILTNLLNQPDYRDNICSYLDSLKSWTIPTTVGDTHVQAIWGDNDPMFPPSQLQFLRDLSPSIEQQCQYIPGGAHFHPIERPWSIADNIISTIKD